MVASWTRGDSRIDPNPKTFLLGLSPIFSFSSQNVAISLKNAALSPALSKIFPFLPPFSSPLFKNIFY